MQRNRTFRSATIDNATGLSELVNYAGEGMLLYLLGQMGEPGQSPWGIAVAGRRMQSTRTRQRKVN